MVWFPHAKINLGLQIIRKRIDGYHDIETCFYPVGWKDILEIIPARNGKFTSTGIKISGAVEDNLCVKAYRLLKKDFDIPPVHIHLHKIIPMGAGLGGGSSDAAFTLKGLNDLFELQIPTERLHIYASQLGSDCAFFLYDHPMIAAGKGDELKVFKPYDLNKYEVIIIYPGIHVPTAAAYAGVEPESNRGSIEEILVKEPGYWKDNLINDFERSVIKKYSDIGKVKNRLYDLGAVYSCMTGSGSAVFGIFKEANFNLEREFPDYPAFKGKF